MRLKERIPIFLELISGELVNIFDNIWKLNEYTDFDMFADFYNIEEIKEFWLKNPDLRFSQVLINLKMLPNIPGFWYYLEENDILEKLGKEPREYLLWGQNYDKDMNLLPETIFKPIKNLNIGHIKAILKGDWCKNPTYYNCFINELKLRENELGN